MLTMNGVGNYKIVYKDHEEVEFSSLKTYILLAKKAISKFANQFYNGLAAKMLKDEDAISSIANAIMMADWRWDENYTNEKGTKKNRYSYRNQCALWAIQTYITKEGKNKKRHKVLSLDHILNEDDATTASCLVQDDKIKSPDNIVSDQEYKDKLNTLIDNILNLNYLSDRQREYIRLYYFEGYTFDKIGKKYNITREAVRQGLNKAIEMIRNSITV